MTLLCLGLGGASPRVAEAKVFHSQKEAVELAFPDADRVESRTFILEPDQTSRIEALAQAPLDSKIVQFHEGWKDGRPMGWARIEVHTVRTKAEAVMVVVGPDGAVTSLRMLAFHEPLDYLPGDRWLRSFEGRRLDRELRLGGDIDGISGATLTARAVTASVRRVLALWQVLIHPATRPEDAP